VYFDGTLPTAEQHHILLRYVTDFAGIQEVVDRLVIDELPWEREDRTEPPVDDVHRMLTGGFQHLPS